VTGIRQPARAVAPPGHRKAMATPGKARFRRLEADHQVEADVTAIPTRNALISSPVNL